MSTPPLVSTTKALAQKRTSGIKALLTARGKGGTKLTLRDEELRFRGTDGKLYYRQREPQYCKCVGQVIVQAGTCIKCGRDIDF